MHQNLKTPILLAAALVPIGAPPALPAQEDAPALKSLGPIAFAPKTLLVSDRLAARIHAVDLDAFEGRGLRPGDEVRDLGGRLAALLGTVPDQVQVVDVAVHPETGVAFVAVQRGRGPDAIPVLAMVQGASGADDEPGIALFDLATRRVSSAAIPNPPEGEDRRGRSRAVESITDLAFVGGKVVVAGLSNEEFASKLRVLDFPFASERRAHGGSGGAAEAGATKGATGTSIEIYHGAHGALETRSPVRTFVPFLLGGDPAILAAYTCTPLVTIKMKDLQPGKKVTGRTVAELGNRNRPLDMVVYEKDGAGYLLIANSSRGVMKVPTAGLEDAAAISERVERGGTAGLPFETIGEWTGVLQLDKLDARHGIVLMQGDDGVLTLRVVELP